MPFHLFYLFFFFPLIPKIFFLSVWVSEYYYLSWCDPNNFFFFPNVYAPSGFRCFSVSSFVVVVSDNDILSILV